MNVGTLANISQLIFKNMAGGGASSSAGAAEDDDASGDSSSAQSLPVDAIAQLILATNYDLSSTGIIIASLSLSFRREPHAVVPQAGGPAAEALHVGASSSSAAPRSDAATASSAATANGAGSSLEGSGGRRSRQPRGGGGGGRIDSGGIVDAIGGGGSLQDQMDAQKSIGLFPFPTPTAPPPLALRTG